jgi:protein FAM50
VVCALQIQALSFTLDDEEDEGRTYSTDDSDTEKCEPPVKKKVRKNPDVDTSFLPDREREDEENRLREELRQVHNLFPKVNLLQSVTSIIMWAL